MVPPGRLNLRFHTGASRAEATRVAAALGGTVVGEIPLLDLYVVDFPSRTERGLETALAIAQSQSGVRSAFPEQIAFLAGPGRACSVTDDPAYARGPAHALEMIGMQAAWDLVRASGVRLQPVEVGIVDSGLYVGQGESRCPTTRTEPAWRASWPPTRTTVASSAWRPSSATGSRCV